MKIRPNTNEKAKCSAHTVSRNPENRLLLCCQPIEFWSLSRGLKNKEFFYQPWLESPEPLNSCL